MIFDILNTDIYYINLDSQMERNQEFLSIMLSAGFSKDRLHRVSGIPNEYKDGIDSHIKALKIGLATGEPFIVIEDDMMINQLPPIIELTAPGGFIASAVSLAISRYGVIDDYNYRGRLFTSYNYVIKGNIQHDYLVRIFNMIVGNAVYYYDMEYVKSLISELEFYYRSPVYKSPITNSVYSSCDDPTYKLIPFDAIMAFMQPTTNFTALKTPAFYHPGGLEEITRFTLSEI